MKWKNIILPLGATLLLALGTLIYFLVARQQFVKCYTSDVIFLFMGIIRQGFSLPFERFGQLIALFLLGLNTLLILCFVYIYKSEFAKKHFKILTLISMIIHLSYQTLYLHSNLAWIAFGVLLLLIIFEHLLKGTGPLNRPFYLDAVNRSTSVRLLSLVLITALPFFYKFPVTRFNQLIFQDDYPKYLYFARYHLNILKNGALFGWNDQFSGGFPSFLDLRLLSLPVLPFSFFGDNIGFHLMITAFYLTLPLLIYALTIQINNDKTTAFINGLVCGFAQMAYFGDMLEWGMLPGFISIWLMVLSLIFIERFYQDKAFSLFYLSLTLGLMFYIHFISLASTVCLLFFRTLAQTFLLKKRVSAKKLLFMCLFVTLIVLPFLLPMIRYNRFIIPTSNFFDQSDSGSLIFHFSDMLRTYLILPVWLLDTPHYRSLWMILPLAIMLFFRDERAKKNAIYLFIILIIAFGGPFFNTQFTARIKFIVPIFIALIAGVWIVDPSGKFSLSRFLMILLVCSFMLTTNSLSKPIRHIPHIADFKPHLIQEITRANGQLILLENTANLNPYKNLFEEHVESGYPHFEGSLASHTERRFLSHYGTDSYPYFIFREGLILSGVSNGDDIAKIHIKDMIRILDKWGIQNVVVFSSKAKNYFYNAHPYFDRTFQDEGFEMFTLKDRQSGDDKIKTQTLNPFHKQITLKNIARGETITLKTNYFPAWKAFHGKHKVEVFNDNGQLSFLSPTEGNVKIDLYFPRYYPLLIISFVAILTFYILSWKKCF